jgi:hypothetical protein
MLGLVAGAVGYLAVGNVIAWRRQPSGPAPAQAYIATPGTRRVVNFKGEDEADGEEVGPVFITDEEDPEFVHEVGWMKVSDARELARGLGHPFSAD